MPVHVALKPGILRACLTPEAVLAGVVISRITRGVVGFMKARVVFAAGRWESGHIMHLWRSECAECGYRYIATGAGAFGAYGAGRGGAVPENAPQVTGFGGPEVVKEEGASAA